MIDEYLAILAARAEYQRDLIALQAVDDEEQFQERARALQTRVAEVNAKHGQFARDVMSEPAAVNGESLELAILCRGTALESRAPNKRPQ